MWKSWWAGTASTKLGDRESSRMTTAGKKTAISLEAAMYMYMQDKAGFFKDRLPRPGFGAPVL